MSRLAHLAKRGRRWLRRAAAHVRPPTVQIVSHRNYRPPDNPFADPERSSRILSHLIYEGHLPRHGFVKPAQATVAQLHTVHPWQYLSEVAEPETMARIFGELVLELPTRDFIEQQRWITGGTVHATRLALRRGVSRRAVASLGGGLHHAFSDGGFGFNAFNDIAVAIAQAREDGFEGPVLVVDLDIHQGDGTRRIFARDATVHTLSIHDVSHDAEPLLEDTDVALGHGVGDAHYRDVLEDVLPEAFAHVAPELVIYVAGVDVADDDPVGTWRISADMILERDRRVVELVGDVPLVWLLGGGYGRDAWRHSARSLAWLLDGEERPIASRTERELGQMRTIAASLGSDDLSRERPGDDLEIDFSDVLDDLMTPGGRPTRLLGFYTRYGLEVALEEYGVMALVRKKVGPVPLRVDWDLGHHTGQMVRLVIDDGSGDIVIELVLDQQQNASHPVENRPMRLLWLEWLLVQNPRATVPGALPGQQHPGLGASRLIVGMLIMSCERLGFDGLGFNPAWYHIAAIGSRAGALFVEPGAQARFDAIRGALTAVELPRASRMVAAGDMIDRDTGEAAEWQPSTMVFPVAEGLKAWFAGAEWSDAVNATTLDLRIARQRPRDAATGRAEADDPDTDT